VDSQASKGAALEKPTKREKDWVKQTACAAGGNYAAKISHSHMCLVASLLYEVRCLISPPFRIAKFGAH